MAYRTPLEARLAKKATQAICDFNLIEDGDRILVGLSGGKDSWALMQILDVLRVRARINFSVTAVTVDSGYEGFRHDLISRACAERGWEHRVEHTSIGDVIDDLLDEGETPCSLCGRLRRGVLHRLATELGANRIALGHTADDAIETLFLNLLFAGAVKALPARLTSDRSGHIVIRPLLYVLERETAAYARECGLPVVGCQCPACGDLSLERQRAKRLVEELERERPGVKSSMLRALRNVTATHLLDPRLSVHAAAAHAAANQEPAIRDHGGRAGPAANEPCEAGRAGSAEHDERVERFPRRSA
jgi:tRNA 2-thiocytidine biosynthesis protein TtcA